MQKLKKSKYGFTLTELAIVIAVIAVLIAVLVPTFVSLINNANESADQQTVKNLNTALSVDEAENGTPEYLCAVWEVLEDAGYNPTPTPTYSDNEFYWYKEANRIVIVSKESQTITFPTEYAGLTATEAATESGNTALCTAKATAAATGTVSLTALDTDEDLYSVHHFENGVCTICNKDRSVSAGSDSNIADTIAKSGYITLSEDITVSSSVSDLLTDSELEDISIDLNGNTLTLSKNTKIHNIINSYVTKENFYDVFEEEYSEEYSYLLGYVINSKVAPLDVTITNGTIGCSSSQYLRFDASTNTTFDNVTFSSSTANATRAVYIYITDADSYNNYVFKNCTFENTYVEICGSSGSYKCNVVFEDCTFTATLGNGGGCVKFDSYIYGTAEFNNCTFNVTANGNSVAAINTSTADYVGSNKLEITLNYVNFYGTPIYSNGVTSYYNNKFPKVVSITDYSSVKETGTNKYYLVYGNDYYSFSGCTSITDIVIPDTVTSIPANAFCYLTTLKSVTIGSKVTSIGDCAFAYCEALTSIIVSADNTSYKAENGNLYTYDGNTLVAYIGSDISNSITKIGAYAFCINTSLTSITIPETVTEIGAYAFYGCEQLDSIAIPDKVVTIGEYAFGGCKAATTLYIGNSVETIGNYAFSNCSNLTTVVIPDSVKTIGTGAFIKCSGLTTITIGSSVETIGNTAFTSCNALTTVYYVGSESDWSNITIGTSNSKLTGATITYDYSVSE